MPTVPVTLLPACLRNHARGNHHLTAAVELLIAHGVWLDRAEFVAECIDHRADPDGGPQVWVDWELIPGFLEDTGCAASEGRILAIAAELAGINTGRTLGDLLTNLDQRNTCLVLAAITTHNNTQPPPQLEELVTGAGR